MMKERGMEIKFRSKAPLEQIKKSKIKNIKIG